MGLVGRNFDRDPGAPVVGVWRFLVSLGGMGETHSLGLNCSQATEGTLQALLALLHCDSS
jgi:hypothetical protein